MIRLAMTYTLAMATTDQEPKIAEDGVQEVPLTIARPLLTRLLREAQAHGCRTIDGLSMFINQALTQFKLFTGQEAYTKLMRETILWNLDKR